MQYTCVANLSEFKLYGNIPVVSRIIEATPLAYDEAEDMAQFKAFYKMLDCDTVQIVYTTINGQEYTIFCDEEGKIKGPWLATYPLRDGNGKIYDLIAGKFAIVKEQYDEETEEPALIAMTNEEIQMLIDHLEREMDAANDELARLKRGESR